MLKTSKYKEEKKKKSDFNSKDIVLTKEGEIIIDEKNKVVVQRINYQGKKYLTLTKYYKKNLEGEIWYRGKTLWLNDELKNGYDLLNKALELYK